MSFLFPSSPLATDAIAASWTPQPIIFLAVAAVCLVVALRMLKRALSPIGALIQAAAAAALGALAVLMALAMLIAAAVTTAP